ncbi:MAG: CpaF family protein [Bdellovibrionales bacterium]|nr:CpaF family protein [Bdellovibrionales bacterium]
MILQKLLDDFGITEISINNYRNIWVEKDGILGPSDIHFESEHQYYLFVKEICRDLNADVSLLRPFISGKWRDFRVHIASDHISQNHFIISLRRIKTKSWTLEDFVENNFLKPNELISLQKIIREKKNILVVGPTGSGKTSFMGAILNSLPHNERCLILEDTNELHIPNDSSVKLVSYDEEQELVKSVHLNDLVKESLRMRPDRLIVGEIRGAEAKDLLLALSTGHSGSIGTLHANSASEALLRLEMLIQIGAPQWSLETIRRLLFLTVQIIVVVNKSEHGLRQLNSISKVHSLENFGLVIEPYEFNTFPNSNKWDGSGRSAF